MPQQRNRDTCPTPQPGHPQSLADAQRSRFQRSPPSHSPTCPLFCPEKQPLSPRKQQVMQGQEHHRNPMPHLLFFFFWHFPFSSSTFLMFQLPAAAIPRQTNLPAPTTCDGAGPWLPLETGGQIQLWHPPVATPLPSGLNSPQISKQEAGSHGAGAAHPSGTWRGCPYESRGARWDACRA